MENGSHEPGTMEPERKNTEYYDPSLLIGSSNGTDNRPNEHEKETKKRCESNKKVTEGDVNHKNHKDDTDNGDSNNRKKQQSKSGSSDTKTDIVINTIKKGKSNTRKDRHKKKTNDFFGNDSPKKGSSSRRKYQSATDSSDISDTSDSHSESDSESEGIYLKPLLSLDECLLFYI